MSNKPTETKKLLDRLISKQRVHMYKPIQIAEILYNTRVGELNHDEVKDNLSAYRNPSKRWRDEVSRLLLGQVSTSSQRFQDNLFEANAMPPEVIFALSQENNNGVVERYIYLKFWEKQKQILQLIGYLKNATVESFQLKDFLAQFTRNRGLKRSIDKAYEIVVYALFNTLVQQLHATVIVSVDSSEKELLREFEDFAQILLGIDANNLSVSLPARLYRAGVTNAADRGLDIWANFGPAVQVKHLTLTDELAEDIVEQIPADQIVIVCRDGEKKSIERITSQLNYRVRGIIVESR